MSMGLWMSGAEIMGKPTTGPTWEAIVDAANKLGPLNLSDQDDQNDSRLLAATLKAIRLAEDFDPIRERLRAAMGTESGARALALGRNLQCVALVADLIGFYDHDFVDWMDNIRTFTTVDGPRNLVICHEERPNNWGTHAGAARIAISSYLMDWDDVLAAATTFASWLGIQRIPNRFKWGDLSWQYDTARPVGINPPGAMRDGHSIDGVLPDDQRRAGPFTWPPPKENYVWEALQGVVVQARILERIGYRGFWFIRQSAILRAVRWLHEQAGYPAEGDDTWIPHEINRVYGTRFPAPVPSRYGKGPGFLEW